MGVLATVLTVLEVLTKFTPIIIKAGSDLKPFAEALFTKIKGGELTEEERTALRAAVDDQYAQFMQPLPPPQPGDPDYDKDPLTP